MNNKWLPVFSLAIAILILPLTANADFADEIKLMASDGANGDQFGWSISLSGDTAIVGAPVVDDNGAAYIFVRDPGTGAWTQQQKLLATNGAQNDRFGESVSISGDTAIVGVKGDDDKGESSGSAYVFVRDPATDLWTEQAKLLASDGAAYHIFGKSVAISGDTAIVGADFSTLITVDIGYAYVFVRDPATDLWTEQAKLLPSDGAINDHFGFRVAIDGDTALVGAGSLGSNSSYVFEPDPGTGDWTESLKLERSDGSDAVGYTVSIKGDRAITGAPYITSYGSAFIFERDPATGIWTQQQWLYDTGATSWNSFGQSVGISGDYAVVGAYYGDDNGLDAGHVFFYARDPGTNQWVEQKLLASDGTAFGRFGWAVSIDGDTAAIGAYGATGIVANTGAVYVYKNTVVPAPDITVTDSVAPIDDLQVAFGDITEMTTADQTVTVTNDGNADLTIGNIGALDALVAPFSILNDTCSTQTLTQFASCSLSVRFSPPSTGAFSDTFDIPSDDPDENPVTVNVDGTGIGLAVPDITVTDTVAPLDDLAIAFGNVTQATTSDETVTITNDGNADLTIGNIGALDVLVAPFSILNDTCSTQILAPAAICTLTVRFEPTAIGAFVDSFDIPSDDADEATVTINLAGTGTVALVPDITVTDSVVPAEDLQVPFGNVIEGVSSDKIVTITNDGTADLILGQIAQANPLAAPFSILNDTCSAQTLTPAASCTLKVRFAPTVIGISNDSFDILSNDPDEATVTINLTGTGVAAPVPVPDITVTDSVAPAGDLQVPFGNVIEGVSSDQIVTITNDGTADLTLGQIAQANPLAAPFSILNDTCSAQILTPAASCTLTVRFAPTVAGTFNDSFDIPSDDPDEGSVTVNLSATGVVADDDDGGFGSMGPLELLFGLLGLAFAFAARNNLAKRRGHRAARAQ
ncbi:MAG: choice-of-anchor D domain-containing protein [Chromatiales bacterium]|nr:choice-of-anchor D domain-containing protein [Gammaproteobacteria bacterium]